MSCLRDTLRRVPRTESHRLRLAQVLSEVFPPLASQRLRDLVFPRSIAYGAPVIYSRRAITGSRFEGETNDFHEHPFAAHGFFEWRNIVIAAACVTSGGTIVEVGANVGTETICFLDLVGPRGSVIAFEPDPALVKRLRRNLAYARTDALELHECALADQIGTLRFRRATGTASGGGHLVTGVEQEDDVVVPIRTLDSVVKERRVDAMIMDIEGAEVLALRGSRETVARSKPAIVVEAIPAHLRRAGFRVEELKDEIESLGYECWTIDRFGLGRLPLHLEQSPPGNWLCLPREKARVMRRVERALRAYAVLPLPRIATALGLALRRRWSAPL